MLRADRAPPGSPGSHLDIRGEQRAGHPRGLVRGPGPREERGQGLTGSPGPGQQETACYKPETTRPGSAGVRRANNTPKSACARRSPLAGRLPHKPDTHTSQARPEPHVQKMRTGRGGWLSSQRPCGEQGKGQQRQSLTYQNEEPPQTTLQLTHHRKASKPVSHKRAANARGQWGLRTGCAWPRRLHVAHA